MTAPRVGKRKVTEVDAEEETCTKIARTTRPAHVNSNIDGADPWARLGATGSSYSASGRGALSGWTHCPLCGTYSKKKHALGRGIANHLKDVHTPWNPGKLAQKIHRRQYERRERERQGLRKQPRLEEHEPTDASQYIGSRISVETSEARNSSLVAEVFKPLVPWTPTEEERKAWAANMVEILRKIEGSKSSLSPSASNIQVALKVSNETVSAKSKDTHEKEARGEDKSGKAAIAYRDSLPPFLMAASKGNLKKLRELVEAAKEKDRRTFLSSTMGGKHKNTTNVERMQTDDHLRTLLDSRDRHKSTAEHWASGGGHLDCLKYLYKLRASLKVLHKQDHDDLERSISTSRKSNNVRRRDGKTCLHYAARNGHIHCIRYLLELGSSVQTDDENLHCQTRYTVDERSGEGTTPLHLACYGGHPRVVKLLVEEFGADASATNDWGCTCAHWAAMTLTESEADVKDLCGYLSETCGISFVEMQGQGHTALHKAAHRRNQHVIQWMANSKSDGGAGLDSAEKKQAGAPDHGGHKPSDIWRNMGGDASFAAWMKSCMGW